MGQAEKFEPTLLAMREKAQAQELSRMPVSNSLYEHLFGYDPIRVAVNSINMNTYDATARKASADTSTVLHNLNPITNFAVMEMASELPPEKN